MTLIQTIQQVAAFADTKAEMTPSWGCVVFRNGVVAAQSAECGACEPLEAEHKALECATSASMLVKALKAVGGKEPALAVDGNELLVAHGESSARLPTYSLKDVPVFMEPPKGATWFHAVGLDKLSTVTWAVSTDIARTHLRGVCLTAEYAIATNGHVMARQEIQVEGLEAPVVVPAALLADLPAECWIAIHGQRMFITADKPAKKKVPTSFRGANLPGHVFPPWEQVLVPAIEVPALRADTKAVQGLLKRAKVSSSDMLLEVLNGRLRVRTEEGRGTTLFDFADSVELANIPKDYVEGMIGLDGNYLLPMVQAVADAEVDLHMTLSPDSASLDPLGVSAEGFAAVVMPMRL